MPDHNTLKVGFLYRRDQNRINEDLRASLIMIIIRVPRIIVMCWRRMVAYHYPGFWLRQNIPNAHDEPGTKTKLIDGRIGVHICPAAKIAA